MVIGSKRTLLSLPDGVTNGDFVCFVEGNKYLLLCSDGVFAGDESDGIITWKQLRNHEGEYEWL